MILEERFSNTEKKKVERVGFVLLGFSLSVGFFFYIFHFKVIKVTHMCHSIMD